RSPGRCSAAPAPARALSPVASYIRPDDGGRDPGHAVPRAAAEAARPAPAPRGHDHVAAGDRADRVPLPPLDRADPRLARHLLRARDRDRVLPPPRDPVAG